ncbi:MAG: DUF4388 domain-containing protein [Polyangiales bacterium]
MAGPREVVIGKDGSIAAGAGMGDLLTNHAGRYRLIEGPPGVLVLERQDGPRGQRSRVLMTGELVNKNSAVELIAMIANNGWRGELALVGDRTRRLTFDQSALKAAYSDAPSERLGEIMVALQAISPDQLARCVLSSSGARRIGEIAIEEGFIGQNELFEMLHAQAERIFEAALLTPSGSYSFVVPADDTEAPATTLHMPVQALLMHSVQRIDEMAHFRERIPNGKLHPILTDAAKRATIGDSLRPVALLADGQRSIVEIGQQLRLDEFAITKKVMQLLQIGCVELKEKQELTRDQVERIVKQLNEMLREIRDTTERHGGVKGKTQLLRTLQSWVRDAEIARYFDSAIKLDGDVSTDVTLKNLQGLAVEAPIEALHGAAHEVVSFAMFSASPALPRETERALSKWVNQRLARMRV